MAGECHCDVWMLVHGARGKQGNARGMQGNARGTYRFVCKVPGEYMGLGAGEHMGVGTRCQGGAGECRGMKGSGCIVPGECRGMQENAR